MFFSALSICFGWVIANHKLSKYTVSNNNPQEPPVRNLLNLFKREGLLYLRVLALFFCILGVYTLYFFHHSLPFLLGNQVLDHTTSPSPNNTQYWAQVATPNFIEKILINLDPSEWKKYIIWNALQTVHRKLTNAQKALVIKNKHWKIAKGDHFTLIVH